MNAAGLGVMTTGQFLRSRADFFAGEIGAILHVSPAEILSRSHDPRIALARRHVMAELWKDGLSLVEIGRALDRDHTTVIYALRSLMGMADYNLAIGKRYPRRSTR